MKPPIDFRIESALRRHRDRYGRMAPGRWMRHAQKLLAISNRGEVDCGLLLCLFLATGLGLIIFAL